MLIENKIKTSYGDVHYWISEKLIADRITLFFLHGLTADHNLFNNQIELPVSLTCTINCCQNFDN